MTGTISMFDAIANEQFPPGAAAYAAYVDGSIGDQPNYAFIVAAFPKARHLSVSLFGNNADALDVEPGASSPSDIPAWHAAQRKRGIQRPCVYASASTMNSEVLPVLTNAGIARGTVRLWTAHYDVGEHICGPKTCGQLSIDADGTQWTDQALDRDLDQSLLRDDFFDGPAPVHPTTDFAEYDMSKLPVLKLGDSDKPGSFFSVRRLQALIALAGKLNGLDAAAAVTVDGDFGPGTDAGLRAVQQHYQITVDGKAGAQTWGVLLTGSPA